MELRLLDSAAARVGAADRSSVAHLELHTGRPPVAGDGARARFWRPFPRKAADVVCGEGTLTEVSFHAHEALQVLLPVSPFAVIGGAGRTAVLSPGTIHVTGPLELRSARGVDGAPFSTRIILIAPSVLTTIRAGLAGRAHVATRQVAPQAPDTTPSLSELVVRDRDLYAELMTVFDALRRPLMALNCESRLLECLAQLFNRHDERSATLRACGARPPGGVVRARDYLRAHPVQNVTLDELAAVAGLSKFYLLRSFYRAYGLTPHGYQMQLRLARARRLLDEGRPLSHVTYDAGFADQSHLTRRFAAFYGLTPARYARQLAMPPGPAPEMAASTDRALTPPSAA
jgi:AraC-like DNA-binding protein